jgi:Protein kinase domain
MADTEREQQDSAQSHVSRDREQSAGTPPEQTHPSTKSIKIYTFTSPKTPVDYPVTTANCEHIDTFQKLNRIGEGTYGIVYRAKHRKSGQIVALKRIRMEFTNEGLPISSLREIAILKGLRHENIVSVFDVVVGNGIEDIFMLME